MFDSNMQNTSIYMIFTPPTFTPPTSLLKQETTVASSLSRKSDGFRRWGRGLGGLHFEERHPFSGKIGQDSPLRLLKPPSPNPCSYPHPTYKL